MCNILTWLPNKLDTQLIKLALAEDLAVPPSDITTKTLFDNDDTIYRARIISKEKENIVLCGVAVIEYLLTQCYDNACVLLNHKQDGAIVLPGDEILTLEGPATALLSIERVILNFLQHLTAIASLTKQFVDRVKHTDMKILDTRKTTPGFRHLEKYAVQCGGGGNHRMGLYDALLIKDNHIDFLGGVKKTLERLPEDILNNYPVIIEIREESELEIVLQKGLKKISRVLLDNMSLALLNHCVTMCRDKIPTEASGNITLHTVASIAETGVDFASVGKITHSAASVDLSMQTTFDPKESEAKHAKNDFATR